jgi:predicted  nucleic acid-binding Zn-ribbon protein
LSKYRYRTNAIRQNPVSQNKQYVTRATKHEELVNNLIELRTALETIKETSASIELALEELVDSIDTIDNSLSDLESSLI